jgi:hypothetical protein
MKRILATIAILTFCFNAYAVDTGPLNVKGTVALSGQLTSTLAVGTAPFVLTSTTVNANLNADLWDGYQFADYLNQAVKTTSSPTFATPILTGITIGANTLTTLEWAFLDGQDQAVKTTSSPTFADPVLTGNLKFKTSVVATGHKEGVTTNVSTESDLTSAALAFGFIRRTQDSPTDIVVGLAAGIKGQMVTIQLIAKAAGNYVISSTGMVSPGLTTGWSLITFDTAGDSITLLYMDDTIGWIVSGNNGCAITQ